MGRQVILHDLGTKGDSDTAYKAENKKYYSSKEAYDKIKSNNERRELCITKVMDLLEYKPGMKLPTIFYKRLKDYESYGYEVLYETILQQEKNIVWALRNKEFSSETSKVMYVCAILQNNVMDCYKTMQRLKKQKREETKVKVEDNVNFDDIGTKKKGNDVSSLLGDI